MIKIIKIDKNYKKLINSIKFYKISKKQSWNTNKTIKKFKNNQMSN